MVADVVELATLAVAKRMVVAVPGRTTTSATHIWRGISSAQPIAQPRGLVVKWSDKATLRGCEVARFES